MKGFKNTTRTQYSMGGDVYAKGGMAKGAAKISKVMGEFKKGELHSGSKDGPKVTKPAQAKAIAMSEARKAGMKAPMKKNEGGKVGKMPPLGETMKSVRRLPPELTPAQMRALEDRFAEKKRPSLGETMESVRRLPKELTPAQMRALEEGSKVRKYAVGGPVAPVKKKALPTYNASAAYQDFGRELKRMIDSGQLTLKQANALKAPAFEATRLRDAKQQQQAMDAALAAARGQMAPPIDIVERGRPTPAPVAMPMPDTALGMFDYSSPASSPDMKDSIRDLLRSYDKYAATGKYDMPDLRNFVNDLSSQFTDNDRIAAQSSLLNNLPMRGMGNVQTPEQLQQIEARKKAYGEHSRREAQYRQEQFDAQMRARQADLPPPPTPLSPKLMEPPPRKIYEPQRPPGMPPTAQPQPYIDSRGRTHFPDGAVLADGPGTVPFPPMTPPPLQKLGQGLQRIQQRQRPGMDRVDPGFAIDRGGYGMTGMTTPGGPPPAGMAPVDPRNVTMMKKGGRTAMPKGKR